MDLDPSRPHEYPRRVLVCVVGMSPAVVTETLYALVQKEKPAFVPTEVHVVTTTKGAKGVRDGLLAGGDQSRFKTLLKDYCPPGTNVTFTEEHIHVVHDGKHELSDIVTARHQLAVADTILRVLRKLAGDPWCAIHASIAGGRKTMTFYMGYAMSLLGRAQDRMSHVLLTRSGFEHPDFFFPTKVSHPLMPDVSRPRKAGDAAVLDAKDADAFIELAPVSFVRLAEGGADWLRKTDCGFDEAVTLAQAAVAPQPMTLRLDGRTVECGGRSVTLTPTEMAWYAFFARLRARRIAADGLPEGAVLLDVGFKDCKGIDLPTLDWAFRQCGLEAPDLAVQRKAINGKLKPIVSDIRKKLDALGPQSRWLEITGPGARGTKGDGIYGLFNMPSELITINERVALGAR